MSEPIPFFQPNICGAHFTIIAGNAMCGKTVLVQHLVSEAYRENLEGRPWHKVVLICPTYSDQEAWQEFIPPEWAHEDIGDVDPFIQGLIDSQKKVPLYCRQRILLILDDVVAAVKSKLLTRLAASGRWFQIDTIILCQSLKTALTNPIIRANAVYSMVGDTADTSKQNLIDNLPTSQFGNKWEIRQWVDQAHACPYTFVCTSRRPNEPRLFTFRVDWDQYQPVQIILTTSDESEQ